MQVSPAIILKKQIKRDYDQLSRLFSSNVAKKRENIQALHSSYRLLLAKAFVIGCACISYVALAIPPVSDFEGFFKNTRRYVIAAIGVSYSLSISMW